MCVKRRTHLVWIFISFILPVILLSGCIWADPGSFIKIENYSGIAVTIYIEGLNHGEVQAGETEEIGTLEIWPNKPKPGFPEDHKYLIEAKTKEGEVIYSEGFTWYEIDDMDWTIVIPPLKKGSVK